jgi:hypothetical protein
MKKIAILCSITVLMFSACNNSTDNAAPAADTVASAGKTADTAAIPPPAPMDSAAMMKAWKDFATPGAMHQWLAKTNGTWEAEVEQWMAPGTPSTKAKATNIQSAALGGRYVIGKFTSTMMGQPFEGMSTMGFDNARKVFTSTWVDNMGTGIVHMSGTYDEATKTMNMKGYQTDALTGKDSDIREEMKMIDDNTYSMAMYGTGPDGKEMKFMEGTFKKKK